MNKIPAAVVLNDTTNWYSLGDHLSATQLKSHIKDIGYEVDSLSATHSYFGQEVGLDSFDDEVFFEKFCQENPEIITKLKNSAVVVVSGAGSVHGYGKAASRILYIMHIAKTRFEKPTVCVNFTGYPISKNLTASEVSMLSDSEKERVLAIQGIYKRVLGEIDFVAVSEPRSLAAMQDIGINPHLSFDCSLNGVKKIDNKKLEGSKTVVISGSVLFTDTEQAKKPLDSLCRYMEHMSSLGYEVKVLVGAFRYSALDEKRMVEYFANKCSESFLLVKTESEEEYLKTIKEASLVVTGQFQDPIIAFGLNVPTIVFSSNTLKNQGVLDAMYDDGSVCLDIDDVNFYDKLIEMTEEKAELTLNNSKKVEELSRLCFKNFIFLKELYSKLSNS